MLALLASQPVAAQPASESAAQIASEQSGANLAADSEARPNRSRARPKQDRAPEPTSSYWPEIRLSGQLPFNYTSNASALPRFADRDAYLGPTTRATATFFPKDDFNIQFYGETYSELYRREYFNGFTRFSLGFWAKYRWGNFDFASGYAARKSQDQANFDDIVKTHDINLRASYYARLADDVTFLPTFYVYRRFADLRTSNRWRFRAELPLTKFVGDWSFTLAPWFNAELFDRNNPFRRDLSVNLDAEVRYRVTDNVWVSVLATATRNFSNYRGNRYRRLDVGPIVGFTTKF